MDNPSHPESDTFDPTKLWALIFKIAGWHLIAVGLVTMFVGFRIDGHEYSGLLTGIAFGLPGVSILGIGHVLSAAAAIGEILLSRRP